MIARVLPLLVLLLAGPAAGQDDPLAKYRAYLERDPYHETVFDQLLHAAIDAGELPTLTADYAQRLERAPDDASARIVLARLSARARDGAAALELLAPIEPETAQLAYLRARVQLTLAELAPAVEALERAAALSDDRELSAAVWTLAGRTWHRLDSDDDARRAFRAFAELDGASFAQRMEAGALLAECGLVDAAVEELTRAAQLAGDDAARVVRAWVAVGRQEERRGRAAEADAAYARAAARMGPGHWQRDDVFERRLALQRARGTLDGWVEVCRGAVDEARSDAEARAFLARALVVADRTDEALDVLHEAAADFPGELGLGAAHARLLADTGRAEDAARIFQELAARHPTERGLHREAGLLYASIGADEVARRQWTAELAREPRSVDLHLDLAAVHARFGLIGRADELLRAAIELAPGDLRPVRALAARWDAAGRSARVVQLFESTQARATERGDAAVLEELAQDWLEREDIVRARRALELARAAGGNERRVLSVLATLLESGRDFEATREVLRRLLELAPTARERVDATERIGQHYARGKRLRRLVHSERRALREEPGALLPSLLLAHALGAQREFSEAGVVLAALRADPTHEEDALWALSALAQASGDRAAAARHLRALADQAPRERRQILERIATLYRRSGDRDAARAVEDELLALDPTSRTLLTDLAREQRRRQNPERAVELLERALALHPEDNEARLALVDLYARLQRPDDARVQLLRVLRSRDAMQRAQALTAFNGRALGRRAPELEVLALEAQLAAEPDRFELGILLALYARESFAYARAGSVVSALLARFPSEPALLELAGRLRGLTLASIGEALRDDELDADLRLLDLLLAQPDRSAARAFMDDLDRPVDAANLCLVRGHADEARRLLQAACRAAPNDAELWLRLMVAEQAAGREGSAALAAESATRAAGQSWDVLLAQGELHLERRYRRGGREVGRALFAALDRSRALAAIDPAGATLHERRVARIVDFYTASGLERDFKSAGQAALLHAPNDPPLFDAVVTRLSRYEASSARKLLSAAYAHADPLPGWTRRDWQALLAVHATRFSSRTRRR